MDQRKDKILIGIAGNMSDVEIKKLKRGLNNICRDSF
jgi:hypothetical protein